MCESDAHQPIKRQYIASACTEERKRKREREIDPNAVMPLLFNSGLEEYERNDRNDRNLAG